MNGSYKMICPNCFRNQMKGNICEACGFDTARARSHVDAISDFTALRSRYLTGCIIGAGGFGITYKAYDTMSNHIVAIKEYVPHGIAYRAKDRIHLEEVSEDKHDIFAHGKRRFYDEAKTLYACGDIPAVVKILDYFQENNTAYFVMEYLDGPTLRRYVSEHGHRLPPNEALEIICAVGETLEQVHEQTGMFHRDISPENIIITKEGPKIIDFGSARDLSGKNLTTMLKHGFAPPEQYSSTSVQGRYTDVYALASTFYYIVSGKMLTEAMERKVGKDYVKLKDMGIGVNEAVSDAVDKALELRKEDRYQTVGEFVAVLGSTLQKPPKKNHRDFEPPNDMIVTTRYDINHPYIEVLSGDKKGMRQEFQSNQIVRIGRTSSKSDIVVSESLEISRPHLEIQYENEKGGFLICDISSNGSYVNGYELDKGKWYILPAGSIVTLGVGVCQVRLGVAHERK